MLALLPPMCCGRAQVHVSQNLADCLSSAQKRRNESAPSSKTCVGQEFPKTLHSFFGWRDEASRVSKEVMRHSRRSKNWQPRSGAAKETEARQTNTARSWMAVLSGPCGPDRTSWPNHPCALGGKQGLALVLQIVDLHQRPQNRLRRQIPPRW